ncbi:MAG: hypothetical protein COU40_00975 [Candidatus Moranbacteria bacterium CG10_big_fil_rev_8_21_14_0_10_35_21]|nr:MAG: hypothetical protein COU40_00975 [Candidatus Moranbacteria bacterium CG10_big_fil_rev_8_21_14_0_10_35_21]PJA88673.1 MAG: hypothetical protein CO139_01760 [Candidatus Moranbacteria bacterium CG_4_9_14_3_um_filter_36_9]
MQKKIFKKALFVAILALIIFISTKIYQEFDKKNKIKKEIEAMEVQAEKIGKENLNIQEKIAYLKSRDFKEKEAKEKLNLQNPDENLVVIKPGIISEITPEDNSPKKQVVQQISNPLKWWKYFFENK